MADAMLVLLVASASSLLLLTNCATRQRANPFETSFSKKMSAGLEVRCNVYDLSTRNDYMYPLGLGIFHSGIEIGSDEWTFGGHPHDSSGVYSHEPTRPVPHIVVPVRARVVLGRTHASLADVASLARELGRTFLGSKYHLLRCNCNHFSDELARRLLGFGIPGYVNRLAYFGSTVECLLPMDRILGTVTVPEASDDLEASWELTGQRISDRVNPVAETDDDRRSLLAAAALRRL